MKMSTVLHQSATLGTKFTSALTKEMSKPYRKQQQFTLTRRIWRTRAFIFGHHTDQQQVHKIKSKCYLNVLHNFGKKDDVAQIEKIPACSENRVSEKALTQFICLRGFDITL